MTSLPFNTLSRFVIAFLSRSKRPVSQVVLNHRARDFPGGPVVKAPGSRSRMLGFDTSSGNEIPDAATKTQRIQINTY